MTARAAGPDAYFATDVRVYRGDDGQYHALHSGAAYDIWKPYIEAFGSLKLVARVVPDHVDGEGVLVSGPGLEIVPVAHYHGLEDLVRTLPRLVRQFARIGNRSSVYLGRLPEPLSLLLFLRSWLVRGHYVAHIVAEPQQTFAAAVPGRRGVVIGRLIGAIERAMVKRSAGAVYVTRQWLQRLYPVRPGTPALARCDASIPPEGFADGRLPPQRPVDIVYVASMEARFKGQDILLRAVDLLRREGEEVRVTLVGGGRQYEYLRSLAADLHLDDSVTFAGQLTQAEQVRAHLDAADIFCMPSRSEGLPRAVVEAMARGLPVVSSDLGGLEELVPSRLRFPAGDVRQCADRIRLLVREPDLYLRISRANVALASSLIDGSRPAVLSAFLTENFVRPWQGSSR